MKNDLYGEQHQSLVAWLSGGWWQDGPPVAAIQGFPGLGKTAIAEHVIAEVARKYDKITTVHIDCLEATAALVDDLVLNLAEELDVKGDSEVVKALDQGLDAVGIFRKLLTRPRLIIFDEAQRLMGESNIPLKSKQIGSIIENMSRGAGFPGRLLIISSREFGAARWEERAKIFTLYPLNAKDAQNYLRDRLKQEGVASAIPSERIADVASWLGGNARAINLLVSALRRETLDYLIGLAPEAWEVRDRKVSPRLLREFETRVLTRAIEQLDDKTELFLRRLAVFRKPVPREALEAVATASKDMETSRDELLARYIIEFRTGYYRVHPIVRETLLRKLEVAPKQKAHLMAGHYFAKAFRATRMVGPAEALGARFVEARYHFTLAESVKDLRDIAGRFEQHLRAQFSFVTPIPTDPQERGDRIALLSALLQDRGAHGMEYHLARCLLARGRAQDDLLALPHLRRSTGPKSPAPAWVLRIQVEATLYGAGEAVKVAREGIKVVPPTQNLFSLYQAAAEILARDGKAEEAVTLLREGIKTPNIGSLSSLYQAAAEILARDGKAEEAVTLLREGHARIGDSSNGYRLVEAAIYVGMDFGRLDLVDGFETNPLQARLFDVMSRLSRDEFPEAAALAETGAEEFPRYIALPMLGAFAALAAGETHRARDILEKWTHAQGDAKDSSLAWLMAAIEIKCNHTQLARHHLDGFAGRAHADVEVSIDTLMDYWKVSCREFSSALSYHLPRIPMTISGLDYQLVRHRYLSGDIHPEGAVAHGESVSVERADLTTGRRTVSVLAVATEWSSGRGGLSTFNRKLCVALAQAGATVACIVLEATDEEIDTAKRHGVILVRANRGPGLTEEQRIVGKPALPDGFAPNFLIGHGRITGPAATALQANHYPTARRVHFVHMAPDEIEPYKLDRVGQAGMRAQQRTEIEEELGRTAARVVAVGPRLHGRFSTYLAGYQDIPAPLRFDPGFDAVNSGLRVPPAGDPWNVLLLGRAEDVHLKGLDTAASAVAKAAKDRPVDLPRLELVVRGAQPADMDQLRASLGERVGKERLNIVIRAFTVSDEELQADQLRASLVLMPSRAEGFGLVGVEAIAAGTPILVSAESGLGQLLRELLTPEQASRVVIKMNGDDQQLRDRWAGAIDRMLADREASFKRAAEISEALAAKRTWRKGVERLLAELAV